MSNIYLLLSAIIMNTLSLMIAGMLRPSKRME